MTFPAEVVHLDEGELVAHVVAHPAVLRHHRRRDHVLHHRTGILILEGKKFIALPALSRN
jgi:hypothetical protein